MTQTTLNPTPSVRCRTCGHPVPLVRGQTLFCPHCGRRVRRRMLLPRIVVLAAVAVGVNRLYRHHDRHDLPPVGPVAAMLADAQAARLTRAAELDHRAEAVRTARDALAAQSAELTNLSDRITRAVARASDEDRWPAKVAGRSLQRADADALLGRIAKVENVERPAIERDTEVLNWITAAASAVRSEADVIAGLRELLGTDLSAEQRADIDRRAAALRDGSAHLPDAAGLTADPLRPADENALLR